MTWLGGNECAVTLTFDVDGRERWQSRARQGMSEFDNPTIASLGEYGTRVGLPRIVDLLETYDLKAGFFVPGVVAEENPEMVKALHEAGHEIGHHGYTHASPSTMSPSRERDEFETANEVFEEILGEKPVGYRTPAADTTKRTLRLLIESGFEYDSTLMGNDVPYAIDYRDDRLVELPFHWSTDDAAYFTFNMSPTVAHQSGIDSHEDVLDVWQAAFASCYERGLLFNSVAHPQIIGRPYRLSMYERFLQYITGHPNVLIARPKDIARRWRESEESGGMTVSVEAE